MPPLEDLLHRIRWDPAFAEGVFTLGYLDRIAGVEQVVPFSSVRLDPRRPGMFSFEDEDGRVRRIPLHRVRAVYRNGRVIWRRPTRPIRA